MKTIFERSHVGNFDDLLIKITVSEKIIKLVIQPYENA